MGTTAPSCKQASCIKSSRASSSPSPVYPEPPVESGSSYARAAAPEYNPDIGQTNVGGYGTNKDPYCHKVEKVVFENQCEPYTEKTCWTQNKEHCEGKMFKNCTGVIETNVERVCFDVN